MKRYREVHSLDYALCILVSLLDRVFRHCEWWEINKGINIEICNMKEMIEICNMKETWWRGTHVRIRPVGWRDDEYIGVRCVKIGDEWLPFEGTVYSLRLMDCLGSSSFSFKVEQSMFSIRAFGTTEERFLKKVCPEWT